MKDKHNLWRLYNQSTGYGCRPSDFFELETDLAKWSLNEACLVIGRRFENMLNEGKNPFQSSTRGKQYAPVAKGVLRKMKIPENGIW